MRNHNAPTDPGTSHEQEEGMSHVVAMSYLPKKSSTHKDNIGWAMKATSATKGPNSEPTAHVVATSYSLPAKVHINGLRPKMIVRSTIVLNNDPGVVVVVTTAVAVTNARIVELRVVVAYSTYAAAGTKGVA